MNVEPTRRQVAAALEASVDLLELVGGRHNVAAQLLRRLLGESAAARQTRRDAAIVAMRIQWFPHESTRLAARKIAAEVSRYAASRWKRRDVAFVEPPESYAGTMDKLLFWIVKLSPKLPGVDAIRAILSAAGAAKIPALESSRGLLLDSSHVHNCDARSRHMFADAHLAEAVRSLPQVQAAQRRVIDEEIAERRRHLAAIETLDAEAVKSYAKEEARKAKAAERVHAAERDLKAARREYDVVSFAVANERMTYETARRDHEEALLVGDWSAIRAFIDEALSEQEVTRRAIVTRPLSTRNPITGRVERRTESNSASLNRRLASILKTIRAAPDLRLLSDVRELPAKLDELRATWLPIEDLEGKPSGKA